MSFIPQVKNQKIAIDEPESDENDENPDFLQEIVSETHSIENNKSVINLDQKVENYSEEEEEDFIPEAVPKKPVVEKDIFIDDTPPKKTTFNKNGKPRAPMSDAHKEKLRMAREKAVISRREKAKARAQKKIDDEEEAVEREEENKLRELKKKKDKKKELDELKKAVYDTPVPTPTPAPAPPAPVIREIVREPSITKDDIEQAQLNAIMQYENLRKQRKEEKKKKEAESLEYENLKKKLLRAQNPRNQFNGSRGFF